MNPCAPPASLEQWSTELLVCACLLGVAALGLAALGPRRWRVRWFGALDLLSALLVLGLALWSLALRGRVQAEYDALAARYTSDPYYCVFGGGHAGPGFYPGWLRQTQAVVEPLQHTALITVIVVAALLLSASALALARWLRRRGRRAGAALAVADVEDDAMDATVQVSALSPTALQMRRLWPAPRRALVVGLALGVIAAGVGSYATLRTRASSAPTDVKCSSPMTAADLQQLHVVGLSLIPSRDTMPVDAQSALAASKAGLGDLFPTHVTCVVAQLFFVDASTMLVVPRFAIVWVVGYRVPALSIGACVASERCAEWTFVDAQTGDYLDGVFLSSVGG